MSSEMSLLKFLLRFPSHVVEGLGVDPEPGLLYHISPDPTITTFVPRKIQRTMKGEDELVDRICTGVTLIDCFRGYAVSVNDFVKNKAHCAGDNNWLGGYVIYGIPHNGCLVPSSNMAPISAWCEERWLVSHLAEKQQYPTKIMGKAFINRVYLTGESKETRIIETELLFEIFDQPLKFSEELVLGRGFHSITVGSLEKYVKGQSLQGNVAHNVLTENAYSEQKERHAELLSYESAHSTITHW